MKKLLSIILAAAMLLSFIPSVFAEGESADLVSVTYSFINGGRTDVTSDSAWLEKIVTDADGNHSFLWNEKYKEFPTSSENPGDYWAYLGTNIPAVSKSGVVNLSTYLSVNTCSTASWVAFKIKVPETATYAISELKAAKYKNASTNMSISVVELTDDLSEVLEEGNVATYGTAGIGSNGYGTRTGAKLYSELGIENETLLGKTNIRLTDDKAAEYLKPSVATLTNKGSALMRKDKEYVIFCHTEDGRAPTIVSLTLGGEKVKPKIVTSLSTENMDIDQVATLSSVVTNSVGEVVDNAEVTYTTEDTDVISISGNQVTAIAGGSAIVTATSMVDGTVVTTTIEISVSVNLSPVYNFTEAAVADDSTKISEIVDYSQLTDVSTGKWKYHSSPYINSNMIFQKDGVQFNAYLASVKEERGVLVLKIKADASGYYNSVIEFVKQAYCGRIDMFVVSEADAIANELDLTTAAGTRKAITYCMDKENPGHYMASIDMHSESAETSPKTGNAVYLAKGENYLLMRIRKGIGTSSHKDRNYYGYLKSISLSPADVSLFAALDKYTIYPGEQPTISVSAVDSKGNAIEISSVAYESLDTSIATVDAALGTITAVKDGAARIKATATIGEKENVTTEILVTVHTEWNPVYKMIKEAVIEKSIQGTTIICANVTDYNYLDRKLSTGLWKYNNSINFGTAQLYGDSLQFGITDKSYLGKGNNALVLNALINATGVYSASIGYAKNANGGIMDIYFAPKAYVASKGWNVADLSDIKSIIADSENNESSEIAYAGKADTNINVDEANPAVGNKMKLTKGEYYIIVTVSKSEGPTSNEIGRYWGILSDITLDNQPSISAMIGSAVIAVGESTTLVSSVRDEYYSVYSDADVKYESLDAGVATVEGNIVTAVAPGVANIKATTTVDGVEISDIIAITVSEQTVEKLVSIAINIGGEEDVKSYKRGDKVKVTAPEIGGKKFRHWVRGTAANGDWVSADAEYSFIATTHTYLTAVYSDEVTGKLVEFFNGNGEYLSEAVANAENKVALPEKPSITGYVFDKWLLDKDTEFTADTVLKADITRVVAGFKDADATYTVNGKTYKYGEEATFTSDTDVVWYRNNVAVAYGKSYTYYVWADATIEGKAGTAAPTVVLDAVKKEDNAYMIEYDACGKQIVEVGIIFGNGNHTVDSCDSKATSQRGTSRGQFTAKPLKGGNTVARGYLVYEENGAYKVVYSK